MQKAGKNTEKLYCERCQVLSRDGKVCPSCGGKKLRLPKDNDPVLLYNASGEEAEQIAAAFDDEGIPFMKRTLGGGGYVGIVLGQSRSSQVNIFVPYGEAEHAEEVLHGIGVLKDEGKEQDAAESVDEGENSSKKKAKKKEIPMSRGRRIAVRIFSALFFLLLVWLVVSAADGIVSLFQGHGFFSWQP